VTHFRILHPPEISLQRLQLKTSKLVHKLATRSVSPSVTNCPPSGHGQDHLTHFLFLHHLNISAMGIANDPFLHFWAHVISLVLMKLDISNLVCRLNTKSTAITHVKVLQYGVHLGSRNLLKFWEISANI